MAYFWLFANIFSIVVLAFYSMLEMAIVSFNKVRLQYFISLGSQRAKWLNYLLHDPARLFGTTLIGVNFATVVGSECAREFYSAIGLDPNFAPISQIFLVIVLGELAPMFAARHYSEHVSMLGVPLVYFSSKIMAPLIWVLGIISNFTLKILGRKQEQTNVFLSQEELMKIVEEQSEDNIHEVTGEESIIATNIFRLHEKNIDMIMKPIKEIPKLPSSTTVIQLKNYIAKNNAEFVPIYHKKSDNIIGIAFPRDLLKLSETEKIKDWIRVPWFIIQTSRLGEILKQFRSNKESIAVVLNQQGNALGIVTLDSLLEEIFGKSAKLKPTPQKRKSIFLKNLTIPGDIKIHEFNEKYDATIHFDPNLSLSEAIIMALGHPPEVDDHIAMGDFEMVVKETSLNGVKVLSISSINN